jgi:hypothetical protein
VSSSNPNRVTFCVTDGGAPDPHVTRLDEGRLAVYPAGLLGPFFAICDSDWDALVATVQAVRAQAAA